MKFPLSTAGRAHSSYQSTGRHDGEIAQPSNDDIVVVRPASEIDSRLLRHDLLAPLRAIDSLTDFIEADLANDDAADPAVHLDRIRRAVATQRALIDGISRFERARQRQPVEATDPAWLVNTVVSEFDVPPGISIATKTPDIADGTPLYLERSALAAALRELVGNSIVHRSHPRGSIAIALTRRDRELIFTVSDDGAGINPSYSDVVFDPLRKIRHNDRHTGPGLGLPIAQQLAKTHSGSLTIVHSSSAGTEVQLAWPIAQPIRLPRI